MLFVLLLQSFLHCLSSVDPLGLSALFAFFLIEPLLHGCKSFARVSEKSAWWPIKITLCFRRVSSVVAVQLGCFTNVAKLVL